jgi:hypothetical protein
MPTAQVEKVHQEQAWRHVLANRLSLPLTVLSQLEAGKTVPPQTLRRAIAELREAVRLFDRGSPVAEIDSGS